MVSVVLLVGIARRVLADVIELLEDAAGVLS